MIKTTLSKPPLSINSKGIKEVFSIYRGINHSLRLQIISIIHKAGSINITSVIEELKIEQSVISAYLKILRDAKIINAEHKGSSVFYSINYGRVDRISILAEKLVSNKTNNSNFLENVDRNLVIKTGNDTIKFTSIELKIIDLVCKENSDEEIAQVLRLSQQEFENYRDGIISKMKVKSSVGILMFAVKHGLFKP